MEIRKIAGIAPDDRAAVDEAFAGIEPLPVACFLICLVSMV